MDKTRESASKQSVPTVKLVLYGLTNGAFFIAGIAMLCLGIFAALDNRESAAGVYLGAGLVLLFAATIDRFESVKGLGLEAKTLKLDQAVVESQEQVAKMRRLTELFAYSLIEADARNGRWDSAPSIADAYENSRKAKRILEEVGIERDSVRVALNRWAAVTAFDATQRLHHETMKLLIGAAQIEQGAGTAPTPPAAQLLANERPDAQSFSPGKAVLHLERYKEIARGMDQAIGRTVDALLDPWIPEMRYLEAHQDLLTPARWFAIRP